MIQRPSSIGAHCESIHKFAEAWLRIYRPLFPLQTTGLVAPRQFVSPLFCGQSQQRSARVKAICWAAALGIKHSFVRRVYYTNG